MTDPIFKNQASVAGPTSMFAFQLSSSKWIYVIGEDHEAGDTSFDNIIRVEDALVAYLKSNPLYIAVEATDKMFIEYATWVDTGIVPATPIRALCHRIYNASSTVLHNLTLSNAEIRQGSGYYLLSLLSDPIEFTTSFLTISNTTEFLQRRGIIKMFEKHLLKAMDSRVSSKRLLKSLIFPETDIPNWYKQAIEGLSITPNLLKNDLATIKQKDPKYYNAVEEHVNMAWDYAFSTGSFHSRAIQSIARHRRSASNQLAIHHLSASRADHVQTHFERLLAILFDVKILIEMWNNSDDTKPFVVLTGDMHAHMLANFVSTHLDVATTAWSHGIDDPDMVPISRGPKTV
jgi:hypothetical protein